MRSPTTVLLVTLVALLAGQLRAESKGHVSAPPPPPDTASLDRLLEHMVRAQLERCPGVEVTKRGRGFLAGRYGGPVVIVSVTGGCSVVQDPRGPPRAVVSTQWSTATPDGTEIARLRRQLDVGQASCPPNLDTPALRRQAEPAVPHLCKEAFVPLNEPVSFADFFFPVLSPLGAVRAPTTNTAEPALLLERGGRTFELAGNVTCRNPSTEIEGGILGSSAMRALRFVAEVTLREPSTGVILGQWRENIGNLLGVSCDVAFRLKGNAKKVEKAQTDWEERIARALDGA